MSKDNLTDEQAASVLEKGGIIQYGDLQAIKVNGNYYERYRRGHYLDKWSIYEDDMPILEWARSYAESQEIKDASYEPATKSHLNDEWALHQEATRVIEQHVKGIKEIEYCWCGGPALSLSTKDVNGLPTVIHVTLKREFGRALFVVSFGYSTGWPSLAALLNQELGPSMKIED